MKNDNQKYFPFEIYMEIGMGILGISPDDFWDMSLSEFMSAYNGYLKGMGHKGEFMPISRDEIKYMQKIFPD